VAFAGIARPERFFDDLTAAGWTLAKTMVFRDHHWFTDADVARVVTEAGRAARAGRAGTAAVLTTEKDAVRLSSRHLAELQPAVVPLATTIEPAEFLTWLLDRLRAVSMSPTSRRTGQG
jgi:tetraacyldisaccharide 4'-kinase